MTVNEIEKHGIAVVRTRTGIAVAFTREPIDLQPLFIEVDHNGRRLKEIWLDPNFGRWREYFPDIDNLKCIVRVKKGGATLEELQ